MRYNDFDIWVDDKRDSYYPVRARSQTFGEVSGSLLIDPNSSEMASFLSGMANVESTDAFLKAFGKMLFTQLFQGNIDRQYQRSLGQVYGDELTGLRIRLRMSPPEISALPWELLYDEARDCFLATSSETPLTRYIELPEPIRDLKTIPPIKVLVVIPASSGLDVEAEKKSLSNALSQLGDRVQCQILEGNVTSEAINTALILARYHIFHFIGHGAFIDGKGYLLINSENGGVDEVEGERFAYFFQDYPSMKLAILNSCQGAEASSTRPLTGVAHQLVRKGLPAVIAMQLPISDMAAKLFANAFYTKLCLGDERGSIDTAISHARKRIRAEMGENLGFITPLLFMRSPTGIIFDLEDAEEATNLLPQIVRLKEVASTHQSNIATLKGKTTDQSRPVESKADVTEAIAKERKALRLVKETIWRLYIAMIRSALPRVAVFGLAISAVMWFASWTKFFNILDVDDFISTRFRITVSKHMDKKFSDKVAVILASNDDNGGLGMPGVGTAAQWRGYYATMLTALNNAGVKQVVFDLTFPSETPSDAEFAGAINNAVHNPDPAKRTRVVAGIIEENGRIKDDVAKSLKPALEGRVGNTNVGGQYNGYIRVYQLAYFTTDALPQGEQKTEIPVRPSLALVAIINDHDEPSRITPFYDLNNGQIALRLDGPDGEIIDSIPVVEDRGTLNLMYDVAEDSDLQKATYKFHEVYNFAAKAESVNLRRLEGKTVLIGFPGDDIHKVMGDKTRYGIYIQANVISNILSKVYIKAVPTLYNILTIVVMVAIGILLQTRMRGLLRVTIPVRLPSINKDIELPLLWFVVIGVYLVSAFVYYQHTLVAFDINMSYHLAAFCLAFALVPIARRKLGLR